MDELIPSIQHTTDFSFENLFEIDDIQGGAENEVEMLSSPVSASAKDPRNCTVPDYSASEILQIIEDAIHYLAYYENQETPVTSQFEEGQNDVQVFLLSIPLKYREKWMIIGP